MELSFVFRRAPHGTIHVQEMLDTVLTAAAFDQSVRLYFLDDGVWALKKQQQPEGIGLKAIAPMFDVLALYDVREVCVEQESLQANGLIQDDLVLPVTLLTRVDLLRQLAASDHVFSA